jgi:RNA polymerase-binding transcription factor
VNSKPSKFDQAFLQKQRHRLLTLREELLRSIQDTQSEEAGVHSQWVGEAHEAEEDAQRLEMLDNEENAIDRNRQRLRDIDRALQKINDGTYGLSDASGEPIPRARLEAVPEAIYNASELKK